MTKFIAPDKTAITVPLWETQADAFDDAAVLTTARVFATADGVCFVPIYAPPLWWQHERWSDAWHALAMPESVEDGAAVTAAHARVMGWIEARPRTRGDRGIAADHAGADELVAQVLCILAADEATPLRTAVEAVLAEAGDGTEVAAPMRSDALRKRVVREVKRAR